MLARRAFCLWVAASTGCAQISATNEVRTVPVAGARPLAIERRVVERQIEARWLQRGDTLEIELIEHRRCQVVERVAAVREEHSVRRADAAIYWEYGLAAVLLGLAAFSFARPDLFAAPEKDPAGEKRDPKTGLRLGGVFMGLGVAALGAGVYDTVRARDRVYRSNTVALVPGPATDCEQPSVPASQRRLALQLGEFRGHAATDLEGRARFMLPGPELWPAPEPAPVDETIGLDGMDAPPARPQQRRWAGTLTFGRGRSVALEVVLPYDATTQVPSTGAAMSAPR